jgi:toxin-antitoxin system PIN domain toxin
MTPDVNVLLAAFRADHPHHGVARSWLEAAVHRAQSGATLAILPMVATGFARLATPPKVFPDPAPAGLACDFLDALLSCPGVDMAGIGREWPGFSGLCRDRALAGNAVPDAWIAAAVAALGEHLVTFDRDFASLLDRREYTLLKALQ